MQFLEIHEVSRPVHVMLHTSCGSSWGVSVMRNRGSKVLKVDLCVSLSYFSGSSLGHFPSALCAWTVAHEALATLHSPKQRPLKQHLGYQKRNDWTIRAWSWQVCPLATCSQANFSTMRIFGVMLIDVHYHACHRLLAKAHSDGSDF